MARTITTSSRTTAPPSSPSGSTRCGGSAPTGIAGGRRPGAEVRGGPCGAGPGGAQPPPPNTHRLRERRRGIVREAGGVLGRGGRCIERKKEKMIIKKKIEINNLGKKKKNPRRRRKKEPARQSRGEPQRRARPPAQPRS